MMTRICKICGSSSDSVRWQTNKGKVVGLKCLTCLAVIAATRRATPEGREASRFAAKKNNKKVMASPEKKAKLYAANAAYRETPEGRTTCRNASTLWHQEKRATDVAFADKNKLRSLLIKALKRGEFSKNGRNSETIFGITYDGLRKHLKCEDGIPTGFAIDHILPMALARNEADCLTLNHYTNLQLLSKENNFAKSDWVPGVGCRARDLTNEQAAAIVERFRRTIN